MPAGRFIAQSLSLEPIRRLSVTEIHWKTLRKHSCLNILNISPPKTESFQIKKVRYFLIFAQNIDCGYSLEPPHQGGSSGYPQSMFLVSNKRNNVYPCKPEFYYIKVGFNGVKIYRYVFVMTHHFLFLQRGKKMSHNRSDAAGRDV